MKKIIFFLLVATAAVAAGPYVQAMPQTETTQATGTEKTRILDLCRWYVTTLPTGNAAQADQRKAVGADILKYAADTDDFTLNLTEAANKLLSSSADFLMVYIAGEVIYCLEHDLSRSDAASFAAAMEGVMNLYSQMPEHKVKALNKYLKMSPEERAAKFEELYNRNI